MNYEKHLLRRRLADHRPAPIPTPVISSASEQEIAPRAARHGGGCRSRGQGGARGFESWSRLPVEERAQWLEKLSAAMKTRVPQIAEAIAHEVGTAIGFATKVQAEFPIMMIGMNAKFIREAKLEEELGNSSSSRSRSASSAA